LHTLRSASLFYALIFILTVKLAAKSFLKKMCPFS
jgi:hypothetical protein